MTYSRSSTKKYVYPTRSHANAIPPQIPAAIPFGAWESPIVRGKTRSETPSATRRIGSLAMVGRSHPMKPKSPSVDRIMMGIRNHM